MARLLEAGARRRRVHPEPVRRQAGLHERQVQLLPGLPAARPRARHPAALRRLRPHAAPHGRARRRPAGPPRRHLVRRPAGARPPRLARQRRRLLGGSYRAAISEPLRLESFLNPDCLCWLLL